MLAKKVLSLRSVMTTRDTFAFSPSRILIIRSWVSGRWYFLPRSSMWIALDLLQKDDGALGALIDREAANADRNHAHGLVFIPPGPPGTRRSVSGVPTDGGGAECSMFSSIHFADAT